MPTSGFWTKYSSNYQYFLIQWVRHLTSVADPDHFDANPDHFDADPDNFDADPDNLDVNPDHFDADPDNFGTDLQYIILKQIRYIKFKIMYIRFHQLMKF